MKYVNKPRTRQIFTLTGCEHRGVRAGNERLVCFVKGVSGLLVLWGTTGEDMDHIEEIERHSYPITIECDWIPPDEYEASHFNHRFWVWQTDHFRVLTGSL